MFTAIGRIILLITLQVLSLIAIGAIARFMWDVLNIGWNLVDLI